MSVIAKVIPVFYPDSKLTILTLHLYLINDLLVVLFNYTLYGTSELRMGSTVANPDDMIYDIGMYQQCNYRAVFVSGVL